MKALRRVLEKRRKDLLQLENVQGVGLGYKSVRGKETSSKSIVILVNKKKPFEDLAGNQVVPKKIDNVETDVIETGEFKLLRTQRFRPAYPGVSIGHYKVTAGTFGALVRERESGRIMILSNNHVLANATNGKDGRAEIGDAVLQPGVYDGGDPKSDIIAHLYKFIPIIGFADEGRCLYAKTTSRVANHLLQLFTKRYRIKFERLTAVENIVDAALAEPLRSELVEGGLLDLGQLLGTAEIEPGERVMKSGRTSGVTKGVVKLTDVTSRVTLGPGHEAVFTDQIMTDMISRPGDSGSLVINYNHEGVGLLFAGSDTMTLFNKISNVLDLLDVELVTEQSKENMQPLQNIV